MKSRTAKPFHTTNLVVFAPPISNGSSGSDNVVTTGDALIVDPGCNSAMYKEVFYCLTYMFFLKENEYRLSIYIF